MPGSDGDKFNIERYTRVPDAVGGDHIIIEHRWKIELKTDASPNLWFLRGVAIGTACGGLAFIAASLINRFLVP